MNERKELPLLNDEIKIEVTGPLCQNHANDVKEIETKSGETEVNGRVCVTNLIKLSKHPWCVLILWLEINNFFFVES